MSPSEVRETSLEESVFRPKRLTVDSPRVLRFGAYHCKEMALIRIEFVSKFDGKRHEFNRRVAAPYDRLQHTYRLEWNPKEDSYEVLQDGEILTSGTISEDFDGFREPA